MSKRTKIIIGVAAVPVLAVAAFLIWFFVIKEDAPKKLDEGDVDVALDGTTTTVAGTTGGTVPDGTTVSGPLTDATGTWTLASADSTVGYRVKETLAGLDTEGAGRTNAVTGSLTIDGTTATAGEFTVDMATFESDDGRRDGQFNGRIMSVDEFPTGTFVLTEPIDFGTIPADGESITVSATGDLTLHGVTKSVTFDLTAKTTNGRIGVLGNITVVFADYGIPNPSNGFAETGDDGLLEFVLVFDRA